MLEKKTTKTLQYTVPAYQIIYQLVYNKYEVVHNGAGGVGHVIERVTTIEQARKVLYSLQGGM